MNKLLVINRENPIPKDYKDSIEITLVKVDENFSVSLEKETAEKYLQLKEYLASLGIRVEVLSGYRYIGTQERIWRESVAANGEAHTKQYVAQPGYSEHHTGLALDLSLYDAYNDKVEGDDVEAFDKLMPHLHKFGFILRYPKGKEHVTGYPYEPWHIRYVGVEAARIIYENSLTLEEYVSHRSKSREARKPKMKVCLFDGYIRNWRQLCEELSIRPIDARDAQRPLLEAGFAKWGHDIGNHIRGSFALAMADEESGELFCARDPLGIVPFYYCLDSAGALRYGSNLESVVAGRTSSAIDREALQRYLMLGYPAGEKTLYEGVRKLMPGHYLTFDGEACHVEPYYSLTFQPDFSRTEEQWVDDIEQTLKDILAEDAETLAAGGSCSFLSGGVDSSYLLALSGARRACSIGYDESASSEVSDAAETARIFGVRFTEARVTSDMFFEAIPRIVRAAGLPVADASTVALLLGCEEVARTCSCCLSGEGADELFAGYHIYRRVNELGRTGGPWHYGCSGVMGEEAARRLLVPERSYPVEDLVKGMYEATESWERLSRLQAIDCALWLEGDILLGANAASRASGLDLLLPYADRRMVDLACRIPASFRLKDDCGKYILRRAAQNRLPREVAFRRKVGFSVPICAWMRDERRRESIESVLFGSSSSLFFSTDQTHRYWNSFLNGNDDMWKIVYAVYVFLIWHRDCFLEGAE